MSNSSHFARYTYGIDLIEGETMSYLPGGMHADQRGTVHQPEGLLAGFFRDRIAHVHTKDENEFSGTVTQNTSQYIILDNDTMIMHDRIAFIRMEEKEQ